MRTAGDDNRALKKMVGTIMMKTFSPEKALERSMEPIKPPGPETGGGGTTKKNSKKK